jgi:hypothetical protein
LLTLSLPFATFAVELGLEVAPTLGRKVEHVSNRVEQIVVAVLLPGLGRYVEQLGTPEVTDPTAGTDSTHDRIGCSLAASAAVGALYQPLS